MGSQGTLLWSVTLKKESLPQIGFGFTGPDSMPWYVAFYQMSKETLRFKISGF